MQQGPLDALLAHPTPPLQLKAQPVCVKRVISATENLVASHAPKIRHLLFVFVGQVSLATAPH
jgi:hypothetical protein